MFYDNQTEDKKIKYKKLLTVIGILSNIFSESNAPYLEYRAHENIFCKSFDAENLARTDCSADAKKENTGLGLKTWVGNDDQKIAEFGRLRNTYTQLTGLDLVKKIAEYRNERIRITKNLHGINILIYHIIKRIPDAMQIIECAFNPIDIDNISLIPERGNNNNTYFTDSINTYHFSISKNTLYMIFENYAILDTFAVNIMEDPFDLLMNLFQGIQTQVLQTPNDPQICLRLYTIQNGRKVVKERSGLNQWNARGRQRHQDELYIPYPAHDREATVGFFPPRETPFNLTLPDGSRIEAKVCQADGKAIMSKPNRVLGEWILRQVFELQPGILVTYEMLEVFGIDSVIFTKHSEFEYSIDFAELGTYERFNNNEITDDDLQTD